MGRDLEDMLRTAGEGASNWWHKTRNAMVADADNAYRRGRQVYEDGLRSGQNIAAQTTAQVARLGRGADAAARAFGNGATFGAPDYLEAGTEALVGLGGPGGLRQRFNHQLALQKQADAAAQKEFPELFRNAGRVGAVGGIIALDAPIAAAGAARLVPGGAKLAKALQGFRPVGFIRDGYGRMAAGIGGAVNAITQAGDDVVNGRPVTLGKEADAFASGAAGTAAATRVGPVFGAAFGGGLNTILQEDDRGPVSTDDFLNSSLSSAYLGRGFGTLAEQASNQLPRAAKGVLGEALTYGKALARGEPIPFSEPQYSPAVEQSIPRVNLAGPQVRIDLGNKQKTIADFTTDWGRALEAKFGVWAKLTPSQRLAVQQLGMLFQPDHWSPGDVGDMAGAAFGSGGGSVYSNEDPRP